MASGDSCERLTSASHGTRSQRCLAATLDRHLFPRDQYDSPPFHKTSNVSNRGQFMLLTCSENVPVRKQGRAKDFLGLLKHCFEVKWTGGWSVSHI